MNEEISCQKLFEIFHKLGGKMVCSRDEKRCVAVTKNLQNYQCNIKAQTQIEMDMKLWSFALEFDKYADKYPTKTNIETMEKMCHNSGKWLKDFSVELVINENNHNQPKEYSTHTII